MHRGYEMSHELIYVASMKPEKIDAVEWACRRMNRMAYIRGVETGSALTEHPIGMEATLKLAMRRAEEARKKYPNSPVVAIQKGTFCFVENRRDSDELALYGIVVINADGKSLRAVTGISSEAENGSLTLPRALMGLLSVR